MLHGSIAIWRESHWKRATFRGQGRAPLHLMHKRFFQSFSFWCRAVAKTLTSATRLVGKMLTWVTCGMSGKPGFPRVRLTSIMRSDTFGTCTVRLGSASCSPCVPLADGAAIIVVAERKLKRFPGG